MICKSCKEEFKIHVIIDGKERNLSSRKFCLKCSPFNQHNTSKDIGIIETENSKECTMCHIVKPFDKFYYRKNRRREYSSWCKQCITEDSVKRFKENKKRAIEYKGGKCEKCGYDRCIEALEFHHLNSEQKDANFRNMRGWTDKRRIKELDKCTLLCSNCHREIHSTSM